jgi:hypothetical protein
MDTLRAMPDPQERLAGLLPLADSLGATYLVFDFDVKPEMLNKLPVNVLMHNDSYVLLKLH